MSILRRGNEDSDRNRTFAAAKARASGLVAVLKPLLQVFAVCRSEQRKFLL
jgi:hypothetical protein